MFSKYGKIIQKLYSSCNGNGVLSPIAVPKSRRMAELGLRSGFGIGLFDSSSFGALPLRNANCFPPPSLKIRCRPYIHCSTDRSVKLKRSGKKEHHLWMKRDSSGSGQKALNLVHIVSKLPNEKEIIYGALDKWTAWETEFPVIAAAKALEILRKRRQWLRIIQVTKWLISKGQVLTMGTYDTLLLAFDMDGRIDEAESVWNMIVQTHTRSVSKRLFSRMISLYDHHHLPDKILEIFADMEELGVKPDEDTVRRIARAFQNIGQPDKQKLFLEKYQKKWKYIHFNGERARVRTADYSFD